MKYLGLDVYSFWIWTHTSNVSRNTIRDPLSKRFYGNDVLYLGEVTGTFDTEKTIPEDSTLLFDKGSEFPRAKLEYTKFKRCIKQEKADYIVVNSNRDSVLKHDGCLLKVYNNGTPIFIYVESRDWKSAYYTLDAFIASLSRYNYTNIEVFYNGIFTSFTKRNEWIVKKLNGEYTKPFITDKTLSKLVNKSGAELTDDAINQVVDMLKSPDREINKLALVTLAGFNTDQYKQSLRFLLDYYPNWKAIPNKGTIIENLITTLEINGRYSATHTQLLNSVYEALPETSEDATLLKNLAEPLLMGEIEATISNKFWAPYMPKIKITLEQNDNSD